jgi:hypothetical protein
MLMKLLGIVNVGSVVRDLLPIRFSVHSSDTGEKMGV